MLHIALYEPEIPPNTGNIIRLCANIGAVLHLIHPLGFNLTTKQVKRAGLDYHDFADVQEYKDFSSWLTDMRHRKIYACSTKGQRNYADVRYEDDAALLFGPETRGLPSTVLLGFSAAQRIRIPMRPTTRSLNLANAVAIIAYEAWRQQGFL